MINREVLKTHYFCHSEYPTTGAAIGGKTIQWQKDVINSKAKNSEVFSYQQVMYSSVRFAPFRMTTKITFKQPHNDL